MIVARFHESYSYLKLCSAVYWRVIYFGKVMAGVQCPFPDCTYETGSTDVGLSTAQLNIHALTHAQARSTVDVRQKPPKIDRPTIDRGMSEEDWNLFVKKWSLFKNGTNIPAGQVTTQLWQCCERQLEADLFQEENDITIISEESLLKSIKRLAVIKVAASGRRAKLLSLKQDHGQAVRSFAAQVKGKAQTCAFSKICT